MLNHKVGYAMLLAAAVLFIAALCFPQHLDVKDETITEEIAAIEKFQQWGSKHPGTMEISARKDAQSPWTTRIYDLSKPGPTPTLWEEIGYPRLALAVTAVEVAYVKYPKGHIGVYPAGGIPGQGCQSRKDEHCND